MSADLSLPQFIVDFVDEISSPEPETWRVPEPEPILSAQAVRRMEDAIRAMVWGQHFGADWAWRDPTRFVVYVPKVPLPDYDPRAIFAFRHSDAVARLDALLALCDIAAVLPMPVISDAGRLLREGLRRHVDEGEPLDVALGIAPASGTTARYGRALRIRDAIIREVAALPQYSGKSPRQAARAILADYDRYLRIHSDDRQGRPQGAPRGQFWHLAKMRDQISTPMPKIDRLAQIIDV